MLPKPVVEICLTFRIISNQRAESNAVIKSIEQSIENRASLLTIRTDNKYTIDCMERDVSNWKSNGWKTSDNKPVSNKEDILD